MPDVLKGILTFLFSTAVCAGIAAAVVLGAGAPAWIIVIPTIFGALYGLETGILTSYDLGSGKGWLELSIDLTWSLVNTLFGFLFGNIIYIFFGTPSREHSRHKGWIVFMPSTPGGTGFGHTVLQTLGTVNLGGAGNHERVHLLQARIFGPLYLPLFALCYIVTFTIQALWTITIGGLLYLIKVRETAYFNAPENSAVPGFFGWIYYATLFELWAYSTES
jgi:hypothetical protein